jgi:hypothetical protein
MPKTSTTEPKARRSLWVEEPLWEAAKEQARKERRSVTALILRAVEEYLERNGARAATTGTENRGANANDQGTDR